MRVGDLWLTWQLSMVSASSIAVKMREPVTQRYGKEQSEILHQDKDGFLFIQAPAQLLPKHNTECHTPWPSTHIISLQLQCKVYRGSLTPFCPCPFAQNHVAMIKGVNGRNFSILLLAWTSDETNFKLFCRKYFLKISFCPFTPMPIWLKIRWP